MPTHDVISYDLSELDAMTGKELGIQLIARLDLNRPKREGQMQAKEFYEATIAAFEQTIAEVESLGIPSLTLGIKSCLADYKAGAKGFPI